MKKTILFIFGTRPEAIKFAPLIKLAESGKKFEIKVCVTGQHKEMLKHVLDFFEINPDFNLKLMRTNQTLTNLTSSILLKVSDVISRTKPDLIFVQGDTTTVFAGALAGYYQKTKIAHLEAGLRTYNKFAPFPEEMNRCLVSKLADYHFAPTQEALNYLKNEGIKKGVWNVGNTVIDALKLTLALIKRRGELDFIKKYRTINYNKKIILVTCHRREIFGKEFEEVCKAIKAIAKNRNDIEIVYPVHLNPNISKTANRLLKGQSNIHLLEPLSYPELIWMMSKSYLVLTDSGGIQEEAPSLGKPVLVLREVTERMEGVRSGNAKLVGTSKNKIYTETLLLLDNKKSYDKMSKATSPYGNGKTSEKIMKIVEKLLS